MAEVGPLLLAFGRKASLRKPRIGLVLSTYLTYTFVTLGSYIYITVYAYTKHKPEKLHGDADSAHASRLTV
jgi:hypothetical protein